MNRIEAIRTRSRYVSEPHLVIAVDGIPLDELLDKAIPDSNIAGFVSSLLGWFHNEGDRVIPWQRILPEVGCTGYAPILICLDDLDYDCTVVIVEVFAEADAIRWDRLGFDVSHTSEVGACVRWEPRFGQYRFTRAQYEQCLTAFRNPAS